MPMLRLWGGTKMPSLHRDDQAVAEVIAPASGCSRPGDDAQRGRLAAAAGPEQGEHFVFVDLQIQVVERLDAPEKLAQML